MIKKSIITGLSIALAAGLLFGTSALSYLKTAYRGVTTSVENSVPVEFQIERARNMVQDLTPEVRQAMHVIAKEEIELEQLGNQIEKAQACAEKSQADIMRLQSDLQDGREVFRYASRSYSREEVTADLSRRFARHKVSDETLAHLIKMRDSRTHNLNAARQKLTALVSAQKQLETDIVNLEAKRKLNEVAQASSDLVVDDSRLARTKELINDIRTRLDVQAKLAHADTSYAGEIQLDDANS
ncbi:MAG: hypothetical protein KDA37_17235, partial [Planctomycetales bacterium]|nr:hypothetical protein [Planctomycetales bacterium]